MKKAIVLGALLVLATACWGATRLVVFEEVTATW